MDVVKRVLHSLACAKFKVLKKTPDSSAIKDDHTFAYNPAFSVPSRSFKIPMPSLEEAHNPKKMEEERVHAVEAGIVRVMKARKAMTHNELCGEVMKQVRWGGAARARAPPPAAPNTPRAHQRPPPPALHTHTHTRARTPRTRQLTFFSPDAKQIRKRIEDLIEREFLARSADGYTYIS
jgi:hypothetical protein